MVMKIFNFFSILTISLFFVLSCADKPATENIKSVTSILASNDWWHCPGDKDFPPVDIKLWDKVPAANLISSVIHPDSSIKHYNMFLPKLASFYNPNTKKTDTVIVIEILQSRKDTLVGYRYITGGVGTHLFRDFHFLTDSEVQKVVEQ